MSNTWNGAGGSSCTTGPPTADEYYNGAHSDSPTMSSTTGSASCYQPTYRSAWNFERLFRLPHNTSPLLTTQAHSRISMVYRHLHRPS
ncbi:hypothetical protein PTTG_12236 [Puccinia triticina 1-1 BBBD Race 1]|uniref:Uncharacterized protein n=2 Tax=Puccinia triticina TaxID=208348 RepID=A0A180GJ51_PUCT1|nr:uncharacterized protein PtA15_3A398 [Puccinia triticina]OAV92807.1 hypothetical protein PTTG_12236 [Puccinia triticina 1-1 BBBD Race 1]WAQ83032.1 hypothetical protein PtA15_3A398 [Puccinia triticina]WAR53866.1 hypothetical protein PtB15_3B375 [Puccinia triticina]